MKTLKVFWKNYRVGVFHSMKKLHKLKLNIDCCCQCNESVTQLIKKQRELSQSGFGQN